MLDLLLRWHGEFRDRIGGTIPRRLRATMDAEDVLQDAWVALMRSAEPRGSSPHVLRFWFGNVVFACLAEARRSAEAKKRGFGWRRLSRRGQRSSHPVLEKLPAHEDVPARIVLAEELTGRLRQALGRLPPGQTQVLGMRFFDGASISEIAHQTGKTEHAVYGMLHRGLRTLRQRLPRSRWMT